MTKWLIRLFVKDCDDLHSPAVRMQYGRLSSLVGILCNIMLFLCKFLIGTLAQSVSITADSVNNLSDAGSSVITLIGFKVSGKPADEGHPFGHARAEYIGGLVVSFMILLLGIEFFQSSLQRILHPTPLNISFWALIVLGFSILLKLWMCLFNRHVGKRIASTALLATAQDSLNDVVATGAVLLASIIAKYTGLEIDGWMGLAVAVFIAVSGLSIARDTIGPLLGQPPPPELVDAIEARVRTYPGIVGVHDLLVHSYGPQNWFASLHAEVNAADDILVSHDLIDNIERDIHTEMNVSLVIHLDPLVLGDPAVDELHAYACACAASVYPGMSVHDFRLVRGQTHSNLIFDVLVPVQCHLSDKELVAALERRIRQLDENFFIVVTLDRSYLYTTTTKPDVT